MRHLIYKLKIILIRNKSISMVYCMLMTEKFQNIRIVLINTSHPGNIGAVARAMKTMYLSRLVLVKPKHYPHADASARASGADDVLAAARVCDTLGEAIDDCGLVFGASARLRRLSWPILEPQECARAVLEGAIENSVAIIFGCEHSGLTNEELSHCHYLVNIPSNSEYGSLNLAAAVQIISYELLRTSSQVMGSYAEATEPKKSDEALAKASEMQGFYQHLHDTLVDIQFLTTENPGKMMKRLRRLFNRAQPNKIEINILRGILTAIQKNNSK